jgi:hypothetical protein
MKNKKIPPIVQIAAWLLSLIVFVVGFWHTHLGLKEMRPFNSEYGSIAIAGIILLLLLITYWFAVNGNKKALVFYIICGLFFFVFNLNYFYPSYMARQLVKEEAIALNDTLQKFSSKSFTGIGDGAVNNLQRLNTLKNNVLFEIRKDGGLGPDAKKYLSDINSITGQPILLNGKLGKDKSERTDIASDYAKLIDDAISVYTLNNMKKSSRDTNSGLVFDGMKELKSAQLKYTEPLKQIIEDDHEIKLDSLIYLRQKGANHPQIQTLQNLVTDIDNATKKINEGSKKNIYPILKEAETRNLGRIKHTLNSIKKRISETDTMGIILVCLFIDLLVPLAIYLLLKKDEDEVEDTRLKGRNRPTQF